MDCHHSALHLIPRRISIHILVEYRESRLCRVEVREAISGNQSAPSCSRDRRHTIVQCRICLDDRDRAGGMSRIVFAPADLVRQGTEKSRPTHCLTLVRRSQSCCDTIDGRVGLQHTLPRHLARHVSEGTMRISRLSSRDGEANSRRSSLRNLLETPQCLAYGYLGDLATLRLGRLRVGHSVGSSRNLRAFISHFHMQNPEELTSCELMYKAVRHLSWNFCSCSRSGIHSSVS